MTQEARLTFGQEARRLRLARNWSRANMAKFMNASVEHLDDLEEDRVLPTATEMKQFMSRWPVLNRFRVQMTQARQEQLRLVPDAPEEPPAEAVVLLLQNFCSELAKLVNKEGLDTVATVTGVTTRCVRKWVAGDAAPTVENYEKLCAVLPELAKAPLPAWPADVIAAWHAQHDTEKPDEQKAQEETDDMQKPFANIKKTLAAAPAPVIPPPPAAAQPKPVVVEEEPADNEVTDEEPDPSKDDHRTMKNALAIAKFLIKYGTTDRDNKITMLRKALDFGMTLEDLLEGLEGIED